MHNNVQPRSAFCFAVPSCPDSSSGTLHCIIDLRQPIPKRSRCRGHIVISWMFTGVLKQALFAKISSISVSHPLLFDLFKHFLWYVIFMLQDTGGITRQDWFFDLGSSPHSLPTNLNENVQATVYCFYDAMLRDNFHRSSQRKLKLTAQEFTLQCHASRSGKAKILLLE